MEQWRSRRSENTLLEDAGYRFAYLVMSFGVLCIVAYRSFWKYETSWDLLALVVLGGVLHAAYQGMRGNLYRGWYKTTLITIGLSAALAALILLVT